MQQLHIMFVIAKLFVMQIGFVTLGPLRCA